MKIQHAVLFVVGSACAVQAPAPPDNGACSEYAIPVEQAVVSLEGISEISGIAVSRRNPNIFWIHEDSGGEAEVYGISRTGELLVTLQLEDVSNIDWEDIAVGPCGESSCVFVADTGDNTEDRDSISILRFEEPLLAEGESTLTIVPEVFEVVYPDGPQDAEALVVPSDGLPVLLTKREDGLSRVYQLPQFDNEEAVTLRFFTELVVGAPTDGLFSSVTAADILPDDSRLLIRTYFFGLEYELSALQDLATATPRELEVAIEPQGEAIAYEPSGGYWQISEGTDVPLFFGACR